MLDEVNKLMKKVNTLEKQIAEEREREQHYKKNKSYSEAIRDKVKERPSSEASKVYKKDKEDDTESVKMIFKKAAKVIGLKPIDMLKT